MTVAAGNVAADLEPAAPGGRRKTSRWRRFLRRVVWLGVALAVAGVLLVALHHPLLVGYARLFRVDDPAPSDVIVLLLGGSSHRPEKVAELYRRGLAPTVVFGREPPDPTLPFDLPELTRQYLGRRGVPAGSVVILPGEVTSTRDEALRVRDYLDAHPARRITLVTTAFHTRRARWVFRRVLAGRGVDVRCAASTHPQFDEENWYRTENGLILYLNETIKTVFYWLKY